MEMHAASPLGGLEDYLHGLLRALPHTLACIDDFYYEEDIDADQGQLWRERSEAQAPDQTESKAPDESHVDESPHAAPAAHGALPGELAAMPIDAPDQSQVVESPRAPGRQLDELAAELVPVEAPDQSHVVESPRAPGKQLDELAAELVPVEAPDQSHVVESPRAPGRQLDELAAELLLVDAPDQSHAVESPRAPGTQLDELAAELLLVDAPDQSHVVESPRTPGRQLDELAAELVPVEAADQSHVVESPRAPGRQLDELAAELVPVEAVTAACHAVRSAALRYHKSPQKLPSGQVDKSDSASRACRLTGRAAPERLWEKPWPSGRANLHEPRVGGAAIGREVPKRIAAKLPARVACEHQAWGLHRVFPECGHVPMMAMLPAYAQPSRDRDRRGFAGPRSASTSRCQGASARLQLPPLSVREGRGASTTPGFCLRRRAFDA
ncbi:unnamed protein product [Effrenium voratum]|uniref:Uncharacterized protein n=1 Tax=Effrenium voratum TaxID=2562239 RepID=A0AA36JMD6_9DINO|nr:unnamed protein product [Effrenium voratum]